VNHSQGATVSSPTVPDQITAAKALLGLINAAYGTTMTPKPLVCSKVDGSINPITGVSIDNRIDTQRRRIRQIKGARTAAAWP
jgi:hypothetical protein